MNTNRGIILIVSDSVAMPRDSVEWSFCWPHLLQNTFPAYEYVQRSARASTTERLISEGENGKDCLEWYSPSIVVVQLGICDCAPRLFSKNSIAPRVLDYCGEGIKNVAYRIIEKYKGRSASNAWVPADSFRSNINQYLGRAKNLGVSVIVVGISHPSTRILLRNPLLAESVQRYNNVLEDCTQAHAATYISPFDRELADELTADGYHLNSEGHNLLFCKLRRCIDSFTSGLDAK